MRITLKILFTLLVFIVITPIFANIIYIIPKKSTEQEIDNWKFITTEDGVFFLLGEYTQKTLEINVNNTINNRAADTVTIYCNATTGYRAHRVKPGTSLTCIGDFNDVAYMYIDPQDFKNGSEGTYEYKPIYGHPSQS